MECKVTSIGVDVSSAEFNAAIRPDRAICAPCSSDARRVMDEAPTQPFSANDRVRKTVPIHGGRKQTIDEYEIVRCIGSGGMGNIYLALEQNTKRKVALKMMGNRLSPEMISRFEAECHALSKMNHSNIAHLFRSGKTGDGTPYYVMEYIDGVHITEAPERDHLPIERRLALFLQVCEGIGHAHGNKVLHRDLKPSNVMVSATAAGAEVKIIDFGLARMTDSSWRNASHKTRVGTVLGTPFYMSPEQLAGVVDRLDVRTDVYALGVVLYEMLTGLHPLEPDKLKGLPPDEILRRCRTARVPPPSQRLRRHLRKMDRKPVIEEIQRYHALRGVLDRIVMKAIEKKLSRRYRSVAAMAADIRRYLACRPTHHRILATVGHSLNCYFQAHQKGIAARLSALFAPLLSLFAPFGGEISPREPAAPCQSPSRHAAG